MISATRTERVGVEADMECGEKGKGEEMGGCKNQGRQSSRTKRKNEDEEREIMIGREVWWRRGGQGSEISDQPETKPPAYPRVGCISSPLTQGI